MDQVEVHSWGDGRASCSTGERGIVTVPRREQFGIELVG